MTVTILAMIMAAAMMGASLVTVHRHQKAERKAVKAQRRHGVYTPY
ncbi:MAG: hypothetical protein AAGF28_03190 [Pseudomonadota bacterium]